jgi:hypothetical protein
VWDVFAFGDTEVTVQSTLVEAVHCTVETVTLGRLILFTCRSDVLALVQFVSACLLYVAALFERADDW